MSDVCTFTTDGNPAEDGREIPYVEGSIKAEKLSAVLNHTGEIVDGSYLPEKAPGMYEDGTPCWDPAVAEALRRTYVDAPPLKVSSITDTPEFARFREAAQNLNAMYDRAVAAKADLTRAESFGEGSGQIPVGRSSPEPTRSGRFEVTISFPRLALADDSFNRSVLVDEVPPIVSQEILDLLGKSDE